jgi:hypothetical protein
MCCCHAGNVSEAMNRHRRSAQLSLLDSVLLKAKLYVSAMRTGFVLTGLPSASKAPGFALSSNPLEVVKHVDLNNTESPQLPERVGTSQKLQLKVDIRSLQRISTPIMCYY